MTQYAVGDLPYYMQSLLLGSLRYLERNSIMDDLYDSTYIYNESYR